MPDILRPLAGEDERELSSARNQRVFVEKATRRERRLRPFNMVGKSSNVLGDALIRADDQRGGYARSGRLLRQGVSKVAQQWLGTLCKSVGGPPDSGSKSRAIRAAPYQEFA